MCLFSVARAALLRTCAVKSSDVDDGDCSMIAMMKNPTKKTLSKVTMSMTATTTVLHRDLDIGWSKCPFFPPYNVLVFSVFFGSYGVVASSLIRLYELGLVSAITPFLRCGNVIFHSNACLSNSSMSDCVYPCSCMRTSYCSSSR